MNLTLTTEQKEFITGLMLGDGSIIYSDKNRSKNPRLSVTRQIKDYSYLDYQYNLLKEFYSTGIKYSKVFDKRNNKYWERYYLQSKSLPIFKEYRDIWYNSEGKKIVPKNLEFTPNILSTWLNDDGCIVNYGTTLTLQFSTQGFFKEDVELLRDLLSKYIGENIRVNKHGKYFILRGSTVAAIKFIKIIEPIMLDCMSRKKTWQNFKFEKYGFSK